MEIDISRYQGITVTEIKVLPDTIRIFAKTIENQHQCPYCDSTMLSRHALGNMRLTDIPYRTKSVLMFISRRRYRCKQCSKTFFDDIPFKDEHHRMTCALVNEIKERMKHLPCYRVAKILAVSRKAIKSIVP